MNPRSNSLHDIDFKDLMDIRELTKGQFGRIFRADYLGTEVACKLCDNSVKPADAPADWDHEKYLKREIEMLKEARHPNIVQFMGICHHANQQLYIVTEYLPGGNLRNWIQAEREEPRDLLSSYRKRLGFAIDTARALAYLHARGIIHRDLKLENLLLTENLRIKVCDFGFSRSLKPWMEMKSPSSTGKSAKRLTMCGTDGYLAPELILCMDTYDQRVDIFAFGICILAMNTLKIPNSNPEQQDDPPFRRLIPGFGLEPADQLALYLMPALEQQTLSGDDVEEELVKKHRQGWAQLISDCCQEEPEKRPYLAIIQKTLKSLETELIQFLNERLDRLKATYSLINVGTTGLNRADSQQLSHSTMDMAAGGHLTEEDVLIQNAIQNGMLITQFKALSHSSQINLDSSHPSIIQVNRRRSSQLALFRSPKEPTTPTAPATTTTYTPQLTSTSTDPHNPSPPRQLPMYQNPPNITDAPLSHLPRPHRFTVVFRPISLHTLTCHFCQRTIKAVMHSHLQCDDCLHVYHKKCGRSIGPDCRGGAHGSGGTLQTTLQTPVDSTVTPQPPLVVTGSKNG